MPNKSTMNDPQSIWQNQPTEALRMSVDQLRINANKLEKKSRFEALYQIAACAIVFALFSHYAVYPQLVFGTIPSSTASIWFVRLGFVLICIGAGYESYKAYKRFRFWRLVPKADLAVTLQSYKSLLEKRLNLFRRVWHNKALWLILTGMGVALVTMLINQYQRIVMLTREHHQTVQVLVNAAPFVALAAAWWVIITLRKRCQGKLEREIEQLNAFEKECKSLHKSPEM